MFGFFLDKKSIIAYFIFMGCYIFGYLFLIRYLNIEIIPSLFLGIISILHLSYFSINTFDNTNLYREFVYCIFFFISFTRGLTPNEIATIFCMGVLCYFLCLNEYNHLYLFFTLGLFSGFCLVSDFLFSAITLSIIFLFSQRIFNTIKFTNFILGMITSLCLLWTLLFFVGKTSLFTDFFSLNTHYLLLKQNISVFLFKSIFLAPLILLVIHIIFYYQNRIITLQDSDIKKTNLLFLIICAISIGIIVTGNNRYLNFSLAFPASYLIGNYLTLSKSKNNITKELILGLVVLCSTLFFISENSSLFYDVKKFFSF